MKFLIFSTPQSYFSTLQATRIASLLRAQGHEARLRPRAELPGGETLTGILSDTLRASKDDTLLLSSLPQAAVAFMLFRRYALVLMDFDAQRHRRIPLWPLLLRRILRRARPLLALNTTTRNALLHLGLKRDAVQLAGPPALAQRTDASSVESPGAPPLILSALLPAQPQSAAGLFRALAVALESEPNILLRAACDPSEVDTLERHIAAMGLEANVQLHAEDGPPANPPGAIAVVFCAKDDLPNAAFAIDSLGCGSPIVSVAHPHLTGWLKEGETAVLVPAGNETALADALIKLLRTPALREHLSQSATTRARERHSPETFVAALTNPSQK